MKDFILKDNLSHAAYSWPETVLCFEFDGEPPEQSRDVLFMDGVPVCYECARLERGYTLKVVSDLPTGAEKKFTWGKGESPRSLLEVGLDNGILQIGQASGRSLFTVSHRSGVRLVYEIETDLEIVSREEQICGGSIEKELRGKIVFAGGGRYAYTVKLKKDLDYIEYYEQMSGFSDAQAKLKISWENFDPYFRHTLDRGEEKIDSYLKADGAFPFVINPYVARASAWDQRYAAYVGGDRKFWVGFLLHDLKNYDDGRYAVWMSDYSLALNAYVPCVKADLKDGKRAFMTVLNDTHPPESLGSRYLRYYSIASLNKVKEYVLRWKSDKNAYPKYFSVSDDRPCEYWYFHRSGTPEPGDMTDILDSFCTVFCEFEKIEPVSCRAFIYSWAPVFDMTASWLSEYDFDRVRAAMAFTCYTLASEDYCPIDTMLAGHPNFLTDMYGTVGIFAALLGEEHPMQKKWLARYEIALARNFKYHVRPAVPKWDALGGRWTENTGCYLFGMLHATVFVSSVIYRTTGGEMPMFGAHFPDLMNFLVNMQCPENAEFRRLYPPQGSHSCTEEFGGKFGHGFTLTMSLLAEMCRYCEPLLSEYVLYNYRNDLRDVIACAPAYESGAQSGLENRGGTPPDLYSCKYTGLGFVLRHSVNTDDETMLLLQQIDEGPNYRWGRAAQGGCGELYYYANRKKYTDHAPEDVGDENRGDVQSCTNFGVLVGHEFRSAGRNELTEPLMDFGFVQYARINAGEYSAPYYRYRSVTAVENKYVSVYDAVGDKRQYGRFAWAQKEDGEFPAIWNVKPAVTGSMSDGGAPLDLPTSIYSIPARQKTLVKTFDGYGDFLTVVSHLRSYGNEPLISAPQTKDYGFDIDFVARHDSVFTDGAQIRYAKDGCAFDGYAGYSAQSAAGVRLAVFDGSYIERGGCALGVPFDATVRHGMSLEYSGGSAHGKAVFESGGKVRVRLPASGRGVRVFVDGTKADFEWLGDECVFQMPEGRHEWSVSACAGVPKVRIEYIETAKGTLTAHWVKDGATAYTVQISPDAKSWKEVASVQENSFTKNGLIDGKYFVRVCGISADGQTGEFSHPYPAYVNADKPHCPEGLRVAATSDRFVASWGAVLGAGKYRLYRKAKNGFSIVYEGTDRTCSVGEGTYCVTAVNGNGESEKSLLRSTKDQTAYWDNRPDKGFVRDSRSNEHGYPGFDYVRNPHKKILEYPE